MKKFLFALFVLAIFITIESCTDQERAKQYGGTATIDLPQNEKLINATWKGTSDIWYLTKPMKRTDTAETYTLYQEKGELVNLSGNRNGKVILIEHKY